MKLWIDDVHPAPVGYVWAKSVMAAKEHIKVSEYFHTPIELIDIDHDAGDYACYGGDYIKLLDWLEETGRNYPIRIHSMNPVGVENMRAIIRRNNWVLCCSCGFGVKENKMFVKEYKHVGLCLCKKCALELVREIEERYEVEHHE